MSETRRRLLTSDEALLFLAGHQRVRARRLNYLADPALAARADANPLHRPVA